MKKSMRCIAAVLMAVILMVLGGCGQQPAATAQASAPAIVIHEAPAGEKETAEPADVGDEAVSEGLSTEPAAETVLSESSVSGEDGSEGETGGSEESAQTPETVPEPLTEPENPKPQISEESGTDGITVEEDGEYSDKEHVALYIHTYGRLPSNYVTKKEAEAAGWDSGAGNLYRVLPGKSIGGSRFNNYEGLLPEASGRKYYECDINYNPKGKTSGRVSRGAERIVYSNDGLIFYTSDHYRTFEKLYG